LSRIVEFCDPSLAEHAPHGDGWVHEIKADAYRAQLHLIDRQGDHLLASRARLDGPVRRHRSSREIPQRPASHPLTERRPGSPPSALLISMRCGASSASDICLQSRTMDAISHGNEHGFAVGCLDKPGNDK